MDKVSMIIDLMYRMSDDDLIDCWNEYCYSTGNLDDLIYSTDYIETYLEEHCNSFGDAFDLAEEGDFSYADDWFTETVYGLESFSDVSVFVFISDMARYIVNYGCGDDLMNDDIAELLESDEYNKAT